MESMNNGDNILDELDQEKKKLDPKKSLMDLTNRFVKELGNQNFNKLTPVIIEAFLKKIKEVGVMVHR